MIAGYGDKIAIGLDVRGHRLAARGWTREGGDLYETLDRLNAAGCARYVVTDVASDGMLSGPNTDAAARRLRPHRRARRRQRRDSSLTDLADLAALVEVGVEGAIIGTALYVGNFTLTDALALTRGRPRRTTPHEPRSRPADTFRRSVVADRPTARCSTAGCRTCWPARRS